MNVSPTNVTEYTVSGISAALKRTVEDAYGYVRVRGEISGYKGQHSSGHAYFTLKDDKARLDAVVWRLTFQRIRFKPEEGLEVIATGRLTTFPGKSGYQMIVDALEPAGVGALMALLEERKRKLAAAGLFAAERKRALPFLPRIIGVVTSPTGAVIRDIIHRLSDRCPTTVVLWPVRVQGETAADEVSRAIAGFNALPLLGGPAPRPDVLIVARGGGSLEDLWPFNEEVVVRAAASSAIPIISAIGHETDTTLLDLAADIRAPTPTGAAELVVPVRAELVARIDKVVLRGRTASGRVLDLARRELASLARAMPGPDDFLAIPRRTLDELGARLTRSLGANAAAHRSRYERACAALSPVGLSRSVAQLGQRLAAAGARKTQALSVHAERKRSALTLAARRLRPAAVTERVVRGRRQVQDL
ncbi:MAG: exodeoxyribonuclease VII large subunit, partial [Bauldia sp.]